ncbi:MAG: Hsp20/alpha crystallin family protein [Candidatus Acidiferrales bacterium]
MTNLANRDSLYRDMFDFRREFDHIFNRFLAAWPDRSGTGNGSPTTALVPAVNAYVDRNDKKFHCQVALPGVNPKDINIQVRGDVVSISGQHETKNERNDADIVYREWMYDSFERDIPLPEGVDRDKISAEYRNGTLEIAAPLSAAALPRRVEVRGSQEAKQLAAAGR